MSLSCASCCSCHLMISVDIQRAALGGLKGIYTDHTGGVAGKGGASESFCELVSPLSQRFKLVGWNLPSNSSPLFPSESLSGTAHTTPAQAYYCRCMTSPKNTSIADANRASCLDLPTAIWRPALSQLLFPPQAPSISHPNSSM